MSDTPGPADLDRPAMHYPRPAVTVDLTVFTVLDCDLKVLLIQRKIPPWQDCWALPGGFVRVGDGIEDQGEDLEEAAHRELAEETGLPKGSAYLEQLYTFGQAYRDPRGRVITVAYYALVRPGLAPMVTAGTDAADARWVSVSSLFDLEPQEPTPDRVWPLNDETGARLAFDHDAILAKALERIRGKIDYSAIAFDLVGETFTVSELRAVHEAIKGTTYDPSNFRRRFKRMLEDGTIFEAPGKRLTPTRPASVFQFRGRSEE